VLLQSVVNHVASYKFVPLAYQIFSRLGADEADPHTPTGFQTVLKQLMVRMCREHPHHVLPQLFALAHGGDVSGRTAAEYRRNISRARCEAASALLGEVRAQAPGLQALVDAMDALLQANIALANHCTQAFVAKGQTKGIAFVDLLGAGAGRAGSRSRARGSGASSAGAGGDGAGAAAATRAFHECMEPYAVRPAVLSVTHRLRPDHDYEADGGAVRVAGYQPTFSITDSGISRPKIVECLGSDGTVYRQLVKGGDDMRQDAVMEQVLEHVRSAVINAITRTSPPPLPPCAHILHYTGLRAREPHAARGRRDAAPAPAHPHVQDRAHHAADGRDRVGHRRAGLRRLPHHRGRRGGGARALLPHGLVHQAVPRPPHRKSQRQQRKGASGTSIFSLSPPPPLTQLSLSLTLSLLPTSTVMQRSSTSRTASGGSACRRSTRTTAPPSASSSWRSTRTPRAG